MDFKIEISKRGLPCLWENGGGWSNTGEAAIIASHDFAPKRAIYVRSKGMLANSDHALIPITVGDHVIKVYHHRRDFTISVYKIVDINIDEKKAVTELVNEFSDGEWDKELPSTAEEAVEAAKAKAMDYHCRRPYFIKLPQQQQQ